MTIQIIRTEKEIIEDSKVYKLDKNGRFIYQSSVDSGIDNKQYSYKVYDAEIDGYRSLTALEEALIEHIPFEGLDFNYYKRPIDNEEQMF